MTQHTSPTARRILTIVATGLIAAAITLPTVRLAAAADTASEAAPAAPAAPAEPTPSAEEQEIIDWAFGLYEAAGLQLPDVAIGFYTTKEPCHGFKGYYEPREDGPDMVRVCDWHDKATLRDAWRRKTIVHELAHSWTHATLTLDERQAFADHRGVDTWNDYGYQWEDRANEHASEIITWALLDRPVRIDSRIGSDTCDELADGYRFLTGTEPANGLLQSCN